MHQYQFLKFWTSFMFSCLMHLCANFEMCIYWIQLSKPQNSPQVCPWNNLLIINPQMHPLLPQNNPPIYPTNHPFTNPQLHPLFFWPHNNPQISPNSNLQKFLKHSLIHTQNCRICALQPPTPKPPKFDSVFAPKHPKCLPQLFSIPETKQALMQTGITMKNQKEFEI